MSRSDEQSWVSRLADSRGGRWLGRHRRAGSSGVQAGTSHPGPFRALVYCIIALSPTPSFADDGFTDPRGSSVLISAVNWLQGTLLGTVATVVAVIAVASVGFMMLMGRMNWRYGATVILGCFILFGASSIVAGIHSTAELGQ